jgi:3-phosphoshikimate 1-carboxyvinyltransferase
MRFLTAYCAQRQGQTIVLDGCERMRQRPIGQLVDALRACGAQITYLGESGFPPLKISGQHLDKSQLLSLNQPLSTQFVSALMLIGLDVTTDNSSPYIYITRRVLARWDAGERNFMERDWSAAAFWYEYVALHGGELFLEDLYETDIQGDKVLVDIFRDFGVETRFEEEGVSIIRREEAQFMSYSMSFSDCPDLYPAIAITCQQLGITLHATGTESLRLKESDRLQAIREQRTYGDHRIAMALLAADLPCDDIACISKSYPTFYEQLCQLRR